MTKEELLTGLSWLGARLREPSSYAGLSMLLATVLHVSGAGELASALTSLGVGVGGIIAFLLPEKKS